jgi:hypothetical protein
MDSKRGGTHKRICAQEPDLSENPLSFSNFSSDLDAQGAAPYTPPRAAWLYMVPVGNPRMKDSWICGEAFDARNFTLPCFAGEEYLGESITRRESRILGFQNQTFTRSSPVGEVCTWAFVMVKS